MPAISVRGADQQNAPFRSGAATVLLLSSERWGASWLTKHNYAATLACLGNKVYFVNPCGRRVGFTKLKTCNVAVEQRHGRGTVAVLDTALPVPGRVREWNPQLRSVIMRWPARLIRLHLPRPADFVIDFGSQFPDLKQFEPAVPIYFPVDEVNTVLPRATLCSANPKNCDFLFSVSDFIIGSFRNLRVPALNLGHGLNDAFAAVAEEVIAASSEPERVSKGKESGGVRVGYIGNIGSKFLDVVTLLEIVRRNPEIKFEFFGPFEAGNTNLGFDLATSGMVNRLLASPNVVLHGPVAPDQLAKSTRHIDLWLLCYRPELSSGRACNSHKLLEYMATGKCIVSNPMRILEQEPFSSLILFPNNASQSIIDVFAKAIDNLRYLNNMTLCKARASYALSRCYTLLIEQIEQVLTSRRRVITEAALRLP